MLYYEYNRDALKIDFFVHNFHWETHLHKSVEIQCCTGNYIDAVIDGREFRANHGDVMFIASGVPHSITDGGDNYALLIPPSMLDVYFDSVGNKRPFDPVIRNGETAERLTELVFGIREYLDSSPVKLYSKLYEILDVFIDNLEFVSVMPNVQKNSYDMLSKCIDYIDSNLGRNITLGSLASQFGYNKNYLSVTLHRELKMNFRDFINQRRLEMFVEHYRPELSVDTQAEKCGFVSRQTFYRAFKKQYGMTPVQYFSELAAVKPFTDHRSM